jgi:hypothetical protein
MVFNLDVTGELAGICDCHRVADSTIVRNVGVGHDKTRVADDGSGALAGGAMNGHVLAQVNFAAESDQGSLSLECTVHRRVADDDADAQSAARPDFGAGAQHDLRTDFAVIADRDIVLDECERRDRDIPAETSAGVDDS